MFPQYRKCSITRYGALNKYNTFDDHMFFGAWRTPGNGHAARAHCAAGCASTGSTGVVRWALTSSWSDELSGAGARHVKNCYTEQNTYSQTRFPPYLSQSNAPAPFRASVLCANYARMPSGRGRRKPKSVRTQLRRDRLNPWVGLDHLGRPRAWPRPGNWVLNNTLAP